MDEEYAVFHEKKVRHLLMGHAYFFVGDCPVGYISFFIGRDDVLVMCGVEVRDGYRGRGFARKLISGVEKRYHRTLHTSGNYTAKGYKAFAAHLPVVNNTPPTQAYDTQLFVENWEDITPTTAQQQYPTS